MRNDEIPDVKYMGVKISTVNYTYAYNIINSTVINNRKAYVCLTDVGNVISASEDEQLQIAINASILSLADGMPLVWYARMVGHKDIERISGLDLMNRLLSGKDGFKHYLLGDTEQTIAKVIYESRKLNKSIDISGHSPPFKEFTDEDNRLMIERIQQANADIIWVSFGGGKQEKWMKDNIDKIDRGIMVGAGAAFKWFIGDIKVPPVIIQKMGLQWLFRIIQSLMTPPITYLKIRMITKILKRKMVFVFNFLHEVKAARRERI